MMTSSKCGAQSGRNSVTFVPRRTKEKAEHNAFVSTFVSLTLPSFAFFFFYVFWNTNSPRMVLLSSPTLHLIDVKNLYAADIVISASKAQERGHRLAFILLPVLKSMSSLLSLVLALIAMFLDN